MKRIFSIAALVILTACLPPPPEPQIPMPSSAGSDASVALPVVPDLDVELPEELAPEEVPATSTGSLVERLTELGTLEIGVSEAPTRLRVFTNPSCAYCKQFLQEHLPRLERELVDGGALRVEFVVAPFQKFPNSALEAAALVCGAQKGVGRATMEALLNLAVHDRKSVLALSKPLKLNAKEFTACIDSAETKRLVENQRDASVTLIPTFIIGTDRITGLPLYADLRGWIRSQR